MKDLFEFNKNLWIPQTRASMAMFLSNLCAVGTLKIANLLTEYHSDIDESHLLTQIPGNFKCLSISRGTRLTNTVLRRLS